MDDLGKGYLVLTISMAILLAMLMATLLTILVYQGGFRIQKFQKMGDHSSLSRKKETNDSLADVVIGG